MNEITRVGVDLAKAVIEVHAVALSGRPVSRRTLARKGFIDWCARVPAGCVVAMEACSGAHHWARKLQQQSRPAASDLASPQRRFSTCTNSSPAVVCSTSSLPVCFANA
jgi:transposase